MKKLVILTLVLGSLALAACDAYHGKQPVDENYYKRTQQVEWPGEK